MNNNNIHSSSHFKNINYGIFICLCIYNFSGLELQPKCEPKVDSQKVDTKSEKNNSNVYTENEHTYLSKCNLIVCCIISILLLSIFGINYDNYDGKEAFSDQTITFFDSLNGSFYTRFLFAFNYSTLCLISPIWLSAFGCIIIFELLHELSLTGSRNILLFFSPNFIKRVYNKILIILRLCPKITGSESKNSLILFYILIIALFILSVISEHYFPYWVNLISVIVSLIFIIITIIVFKRVNHTNMSICDILFGIKSKKNTPSIDDLRKTINKLLPDKATNNNELLPNDGATNNKKNNNSI